MGIFFRKNLEIRKIFRADFLETRRCFRVQELFFDILFDQKNQDVGIL